ncbi:MAG: SDR family oxidoreductase [Neomegalonema sp.]|nr:SDR family oxidoreductase [Neomegalonema sp.]
MSAPQVVLVTGASQGIGLATARALVEGGHKVVLAARSQEKLDAAAAELGANAAGIACDVGQPESVDALFAQIKQRHGRLDAVFNNAGVNVKAASVDELSWEEWRRVVGTNLDGAFLIARGAFAMMRAQDPQGGRIVNNGSISAYAPRYHSAPYTASKHAISGLTKSVSLDGRPYNIACGQIDIGNVASDMTERMKGGVPQADGEMKPEPTFDVVHVANAVKAMIELPLSANVMFQTIMATKMPFIGRG